MSYRFVLGLGFVEALADFVYLLPLRTPPWACHQLMVMGAANANPGSSMTANTAKADPQITQVLHGFLLFAEFGLTAVHITVGAFIVMKTKNV